ncbi:type II toxin-antitoxin system HicA family toxin [Candidatus Gottesmanbacteria bacterium]|nr:type II toxin-antitoxin system HicA family toxin [Candidatus Gottesmanbacteria bacterium]
MSKTPRGVKPADVLRALKKEGFGVDRQTGSHARLKHPDGRATSIALHHKPMFHGTLRKILKEVDISVEKFQKLLK